MGRTAYKGKGLPNPDLRFGTHFLKRLDGWERISVMTAGAMEVLAGRAYGAVLAPLSGKK